MRPVDTGPLSPARQIEGMQFLHIIAQNELGTNWASTIKILREPLSNDPVVTYGIIR